MKRGQVGTWARGEMQKGQGQGQGQGQEYEPNP